MGDERQRRSRMMLNIVAATRLDLSGGGKQLGRRQSASARRPTPTRSFRPMAPRFQITGAKLEISPVPTPLVREPFQRMLARCQRYYEKSYDIGVAIGSVSLNGNADLIATFGTASAGAWGKDVGFIVTKRAAPTVTLYSPATGASGKVRDSFNGADVTGNLQNVGARGFVYYARRRPSARQEFRCRPIGPRMRGSKMYQLSLQSSAASSGLRTARISRPIPTIAIGPSIRNGWPTGNTPAPAPVIVAPAPVIISDRQFFQTLAVEGRITEDEALAAVKTGELPATLQTLVAACRPINNSTRG
jgi:hypothetical protein